LFFLSQEDEEGQEDEEAQEDEEDGVTSPTLQYPMKYEISCKWKTKISCKWKMDKSYKHENKERGGKLTLTQPTPNTNPNPTRANPAWS
jgi:hypothetical protein